MADNGDDEPGDDDQGERPFVADPETVAVMVYAMRLVHAWTHGLPAGEIVDAFTAAIRAHPLWRREYDADPEVVPASDAGPQEPGHGGGPGLKLVD
jgi:hypothetical protein